MGSFGVLDQALEHRDDRDTESFVVGEGHPARFLHTDAARKDGNEERRSVGVASALQRVR